MKNMTKWIKTDSIPAHYIGSTEDTVDIECCLDFENKIYEERIFPKSLFEGVNLKPDSYFILKIHNKTNKIRIKITEDPKQAKFFPVVDWGKFKKLFDKKKRH